MTPDEEDLAQRFEDWAWWSPTADLLPREEEEQYLERECSRAGVRLEEVLARPEVLDETLALALQKRFFNSKSFVELFYRRYEDRILHWLSPFDPDEQRRRDVVQGLFLKFWEPVHDGGLVLPGFDPSQVFRSWLFTVACREWISQVHRKRWCCAMPEGNDLKGPDSTEQEVLVRELRERLLGALAQLPEKQKEVMELILKEVMELTMDGHTTDEETTKEIAKPMDPALNDVYRLRHKARESLARLLDIDRPPSKSGRKPKKKDDTDPQS
jgi:RNA polymerase sigma factor (sigma-70 family)